MKIHRLPLLRFYDLRRADTGYGTHVSAITGLMGEDIILGLLEHFLQNRKGYETQLLSYRCVPGTASGARLDAWLLAKRETKSELFQIEIKNWCASSIGGIPVPLELPPEEVHPIAERNFTHYFRNENNAKKILKVLFPMRPPQGYEQLSITPLVALWAPVAHTKSLDSYFSVKNWHFNQERFPEFHVFSSSIYLRSLSADQIDIGLPRLIDRLAHIHEIVEMKTER